MNKRYNEYFAVLAALIISAVLASGCSTPAQTGNLYSGETQTVNYVAPNYGYGTQNTSGSYYQCVNVLTQYGTQQQCYQVSSPAATSYSQYNTTRSGFAKGVSEEAKAQAYASYLSALDQETAQEMKSQYDALIAQYSK